MRNTLIAKNALTIKEQTAEINDKIFSGKSEVIEASTLYIVAGRNKETTMNAAEKLSNEPLVVSWHYTDSVIGESAIEYLSDLSALYTIKIINAGLKADDLFTIKRYVARYEGLNTRPNLKVLVTSGEFEEDVTEEVKALVKGSQGQIQKFEDAVSTDRMKVLNELASEPFVVDGIITKGTSNLWFGIPGCYKSFLAVSIAGSVATGLRFGNQQVRKEKVLYLAGEGAKGLHKRFAAWELANGFEVGYLQGRADILAYSSPLVDIAETLKNFCLLHDYGLIIIDTMSKFMNGAENSNDDVRDFARVCDDITNDCDASILIIHHESNKNSGKDSTSKGARGASAIMGDFETVMKVEKYKAWNASADGVVRLTARDTNTTKQKEGGREEISFEVKQQSIGIMQENGQTMGSLVVGREAVQDENDTCIYQEELEEFQAAFDKCEKGLDDFEVKPKPAERRKAAIYKIYTDLIGQYRETHKMPMMHISRMVDDILEQCKVYGMTEGSKSLEKKYISNGSEMAVLFGFDNSPEKQEIILKRLHDGRFPKIAGSVENF